MLWLNCVIVLTIATFSNQYNLTIDFKKVAVPEIYAHHVKKYFSTIEKHKTTCENHVEHYLDTLISSNEWWAKQMFDAGTKIPSGFLNGKMGDFGSFDECLAAETRINNITVYGKYCVGSIPVNTGKLQKIFDFRLDQQSKIANLDGEVGFMFATCMPDSCTVQDIQDIYRKSGLMNNIKFYDQFCQTKSEKAPFGHGDIAFVSFLGVVLLIMMLSTTYDIYLIYNNKKHKHNIILVAFSVLTNGKKLLTITNNPNQITCLHGLRVISMMWVILGHRYRSILLHPVGNGIDVLKWKDTVGNMYIMGSTVAVDTFLLLSGLVVAYSFISAINKGFKFNIIIFYIHRYIRLTPVFAVLMLLHITIIIHLGSGPFWKYDITKLSDDCTNNWWISLLYLQNIINSNGICIGQSWYLSVDTQLYLIAPLILFPLIKWPNIGIIFTSSLGFASMLISFIIGYTYKLHGFAVANVGSDYLTKYYMPTYTRATPWFMGILLGYYIYKIKKSNKKIILNKLLVLVMWIIAFGILVSCVFTGHNTLTDPYDRIANSFYIALMRPGWAAGVSVVILLCELGYGGPINWLLSAPIFEILSKLTYTMYLTHMSLQFIIVSQYRVVPDHRDLDGMHGYWGDFVFTAAVSLMFTLAFESPIIALEKVIFGNTTKREKTRLESEA